MSAFDDLMFTGRPPPVSPGRLRVQAAAETLLARIEDEVEEGDADELGELSYALANLHQVMHAMRGEEQWGG